MSVAQRRTVLRVCGVVFAILAASDLRELLVVIAGRSSDPAPLVVGHVASGITGVAAAVGLWRGASWASYATIAWGIATALLVATLQPILDLPLDARPGLWGAAAGIMVAALLVARYARGTMKPQSNDVASHRPP